MILLLEVVLTGITGWPLASGGADLEGPKQFYSHVWHLAEMVDWHLFSTPPLQTSILSFRPTWRPQVLHAVSVPTHRK